MKKTKLFITALLVTGFQLSIFNCSAQYSLLHSFATADGTNPGGDLVSDGTYLYGMTSAGGANSKGTIFKIKPDGTSYTVTLNFSNTTGNAPNGSLIYDGTYLYGMTVIGTNNNGNIFKIKPDGSGYVSLHDFAGGISDGKYPYGSLINISGTLYGMTNSSGANGDGTIFSITTSGTNYSTLHNFSGAAGNPPTVSSDGNAPKGSLIYDGTWLYGMTSVGGQLNAGAIFKIKPDGTGYLDMYECNPTNNPYGSLISDGTNLYGMTSGGGTSNYGIIFSADIVTGTGGSTPTTLHNFTGGTADGFHPFGSLVASGSVLYGLTQQGGANNGSANSGTLFQINNDGSGYSKLLDFGGGTATGYAPQGSLILAGNALYGMTANGGANGKGTIFKYGITASTTYSITLSASPGNGGTVSGGGSFNSGASATITATPNSGYTFTNWTESGSPFSTSSSYTITNITANRTFVANFTAVVGISNIDADNSISIYPNPTTGQITVDAPTLKGATIVVCNVLGDKIYESAFQGGGQIDLSSQPNGIYFISITTKAGTVNKKIVVSK